MLTCYKVTYTTTATTNNKTKQFASALKQCFIQTIRIELTISVYNATIVQCTMLYHNATQINKLEQRRNGKGV